MIRAAYSTLLCALKSEYLNSIFYINNFKMLCISINREN